MSKETIDFSTLPETGQVVSQHHEVPLPVQEGEVQPLEPLGLGLTAVAVVYAGALFAWANWRLSRDQHQ